MEESNFLAPWKMFCLIGSLATDGQRANVSLSEAFIGTALRMIIRQNTMALPLLNYIDMSRMTFGVQQIKSIAHSRPKRILIVESDSPIREGLARALTLESFEVTTAATGSEVLSSPDELASVDTVLLDLDRPDENRWQAVRRLGNANPVLAVIGMTGRSTHSSLAAAAELHAVVEKPFEIPALLRLLRESPLDSNLS